MASRSRREDAVPVPPGRIRLLLAVTVVLALVAGAGAVVVERRQRRALEARVERLEDERRQAAASERAESPEREEEGDGVEGGSLLELLESLLGAEGGGGVGEALGSSFVEDCASALAGATPDGGLAGLFDRDDPTRTDPARQVQEIAAAVEEIRGLHFRQVPAPTFVSPAEMQHRVEQQLAEELPPGALADQTQALVALGALEPKADLRSLTVQALSEQVAGFYDPESTELVVARRGSSGLPADARIILAHELEHALADQTLDLPVADGQPAPGGEDEALARLALVEGDATLAMQLYAVQHVGFLDQLSGLGGAAAAQEKLARLPAYVQSSLAFPYVAGLSYACRLHAQGGWKAVDGAYAALPSTTAQVLFPDRLGPGGEAVDTRDPSAPGAGWQAAPLRSFGAAQLLWLLEAPGGDPDRALDDALERTAGWAGGEVRTWTKGDLGAVGVVLAQPAGKPALCATVRAWYGAAFPDDRPAPAGPGEELTVDGAGQDAVLRCAGEEVRLGIGPDLATARAVAR